MMGPLLIGIYIFVLAIFVGVELITKVPPTLVDCAEGRLRARRRTLHHGHPGGI
jgi:hypothetical protein